MKLEYPEDTSASFIDNDPALNLETDTLLRSLFNVLFIPTLNSLSKRFKGTIRKTNKSAAEVIDNATNHQALEVLYNKGGLTGRNISKKFFQEIWFNLDNSKAVRNRLKFVIRELKNHLRSIAGHDQEINIISIASGSARAIIEAVAEENYLQNAKLSITFLDKNKNAIEYSKKLSTKIDHLPIKLEWINDTVSTFLKTPISEKFDIVEIVGLLDYFNDEKVIETFKGIYSILVPGGIVITANINHNKEEKFITNVIEWPMIYRTTDELSSLLVQAGFGPNKMKKFYEPLQVHGMVVARK